jgi:uncharacterized protein (DUF2267 family)
MRIVIVGSTRTQRETRRAVMSTAHREHAASFIDRTVEKTNVWLQGVGKGMGVEDKHVAYLVLRSVLHALRDRLDVNSSAHLSAQLPMLVRGLYFEGWNPTAKPSQTSYPEFIERIERDALLKGTSEAEDAARAVFELLWEQLGDGVMSKITSTLPAEYAPIM